MKDVTVMRTDTPRLQQFSKENSACLKVRVSEANLGAVQGLSVTDGYRLTCLGLGSGILIHLDISDF